MLSKAEVETKLRKLKPELASNFNVSRIGFFGSYESGQQDENSDLDLIVEFSEPIGWKFFTLESYLEKVFGIPIDLVTESALKERIKSPILHQVQYV
jgi:predicted nucleotidyltransferase